MPGTVPDLDMDIHNEGNNKYMQGLVVLLFLHVQMYVHTYNIVPYLGRYVCTFSTFMYTHTITVCIFFIVLRRSVRQSLVLVDVVREISGLKVLRKAWIDTLLKRPPRV